MYFNKAYDLDILTFTARSWDPHGTITMEPVQFVHAYPAVLTRIPYTVVFIYENQDKKILWYR